MTEPRLTVVTHPLVQHKLSYLRDKDTPTVHFRKLVNELRSEERRVGKECRL